MPMYECNMSETTSWGEPHCCTPESTECFSGEAGGYAVNVTSAQDVKTAVAWAAQHNVALSVKSTGHDF